jgi:hypothetical protein
MSLIQTVFFFFFFFFGVAKISYLAPVTTHFASELSTDWNDSKM